MTCKRCKGIESWHNWQQKPYCSPYCKNGLRSEGATPGEWSRHQKAELREFEKDTLQPIKKDGQINAAFVRAHGTKAIEKNMKLPRKVILENAEMYG